MKRFVSSYCAFLALAASLSAQLSVPQPGFARFPDGSIHFLRGIEANFIVDRRAITAADHASFSSAGGLTSSQGLIQLMDSNGNVLAQYQSAESAPLLNIDSSLQTAVVWLPSKHLLLTWNGESFSQTPVDDSAFGGQTTFIQLAPSTGTTAQAPVGKEGAHNIHFCALQSLEPKVCLARPSSIADGPPAPAATADFFIRQADSSVAEIALSLPTARVLSFVLLPGAHDAVFVQQGWLLFQEGGDLVAQLSDGTSQTMELSSQPLPAGDLIIERMSDGWLHVSSLASGTHWAVHLQSFKWSVSLLPPPVVSPVREEAR